MQTFATQRARRMKAGWTTHLAGASGGLGFTLVIAAGLTLFSRPPAGPTAVIEEEEIRSIELPEPPPPPPASPPTAEGTPLPPAPLVFDEAPTSSTVRIAPTPIPIEPLITEARPSYALAFDYSPGQFRPGTAAWEPDVNHVFQRSEVDQQVAAIFRKVPNIPASLLREVTNPRVRVLLVVNTDGTAENVRLLKGTHPEFDRLVIEALAQWRFRPAVRKGKKVRCLTEVPVYVRVPSANPFSTR